MSKRTRVEKVMGEEKRKSLTLAPPSTQDQTIQINDVIDQEGWIESTMRSGSDTFSLLVFDLMSVGTQSKEGQIWDTPDKELVVDEDQSFCHS